MTNLPLQISWCNATMIEENSLPTPTKQITWDLILCGYVATALQIAGTIGNILSLIVLFSKEMRASSTSVYLIALTMAHSLILPLMFLSVGARRFFSLQQQYDSELFIILLKSMPYLLPIIVTAQVSAIYLLIAFTYDCYIYVCRPIEAEKWCRHSNAFIVVICTISVATLYNIPSWLEYTTEEQFQETCVRFNETHYLKAVESRLIFKFTDLAKQTVFKTVVHMYLYVPFIVLIPITLLSFFNFCVIRSLFSGRSPTKLSCPNHYSCKCFFKLPLSKMPERRTFSRTTFSRTTISSQEPDERSKSLLQKPTKSLTNANRSKKLNKKFKLVILLSGIVIAFFICQLPNFALMILYCFKFQISPMMKNICTVLVVTHSATNFFVYFLFGEKFRTAAMKYLNCFVVCYGNVSNKITISPRSSFRSFQRSVRYTASHSPSNMNSGIENLCEVDLLTTSNFRHPQTQLTKAKIYI
ncbi:hypothetical protein SNEBB_006466 [Seison nebaliae]|nr:hypothetical protein SNEBB_006466 [Seison nebaliae]